MAVYTQLSHSDISDFLAHYSVGKLLEFRGIADGVSNTNYLLITTSGKYILTIFEDRKNFAANDLPFFIGLTEHLARKGIPCPRPIHIKKGDYIGNLKGKPAVLVEFLSGEHLQVFSQEHLYKLGEMVAKLHLATAGFFGQRTNALGLANFPPLFSKIQNRADEIAAGLGKIIADELAYLQDKEPTLQFLPHGIIHADIFPDNVFFANDSKDKPQVSGIIDFYFACNGYQMYDLMIVLNAWCFKQAGGNWKLEPELAEALLAGYISLRPLSPAEIASMPTLGRLAAMRFLLTRAIDWLNPPESTNATLKNPLEYSQKLAFWQSGGWQP